MGMRGERRGEQTRGEGRGGEGRGGEGRGGEKKGDFKLLGPMLYRQEWLATPQDRTDE